MGVGVAIILENILDAAELLRLQAFIARANWRDGAATAGWHAQRVKHNEQADGVGIDAARSTVGDALARNEPFRSCALPRNMSTVLFSRYLPGMEYGLHVDDALMAVGPARLRSDLAMTIFLSDLDSYTGGGLLMPGAPEGGFRLRPGHGVLYPATSLHQVLPVETGARVAAVFWIQSIVREDAARETLFDLSRAGRMIFDKEGKSAAFDLISKSHANLLRRWAEV